MTFTWEQKEFNTLVTVCLSVCSPISRTPFPFDECDRRVCFASDLVFIKFCFSVLISNVSSRWRKSAKATEKSEWRTRQTRRRRGARTAFEWRMDNFMVHCIRSFVAQCRCDQPKRSTLQIILCVNIERTEITLIRRHRWRLQYIISHIISSVCVRV